MERFAVVLGCFLILATGTDGAIITFDDLMAGAASYGFDSDGDTLDDLVFAMADASAFVTGGFGSSQTYIDEPGLGGTSRLSPDLRVDFPGGAQGTLSFGFALNASTAGGTASLLIYDVSDTLLASTTVFGLYTAPSGPSTYPEGHVYLPFAGMASYATVDFTANGGTFVIDNFEGMYGTDQAKGIPAPGALLLGSLGMALVGWYRWRHAF